MSSYRDGLLQGSFRGAPFQKVDDDLAVGRRTADHEYVGDVDPYSEDMGPMQEQGTISAFVAGADFEEKRDALIAAFRKPGPGKLVHPDYGEMWVTASARVKHSTSQGRAAFFSITFKQAGSNQQPQVEVDTAAKVFSVADAARAPLLADFASRFKLSGVASFVSESAQATVKSFSSAVSGFGGGALLLEAESLSSSVSDLVSVPQDLAGQVFDLVGRIEVLSSSPQQAMQGLKSLMGYEVGLPVLTETPSRQQEAANAVALQNLFQVSALVAGVRAVVKQDFESSNDALLQRNELVDAVLSKLDVVDDGAYVALLEVRNAVVADMDVRVARLPEVSVEPLPSTASALTLAYQRYGSIDRADEIVARNKLIHPGFVPGGESLEWLDG